MKGGLMAFNKTPNVAQYKGADWSNFVKTVHNCTPQSAQRIAMRDPNITFFFFCREYMVLEGKGNFSPGDAVFFTGQPWWGSAPQCNAYQKDFLNVGYFDSKGGPFRNVGCYTLEDGRPFFDVAVLFAANINGASADKPVLSFNDTISKALNSGDVKYLQDLGITVLLSVLGNHQQAGWSCFSPNMYAAAQDFARQCADAVQKYGLDGIDIDDEYNENCRGTYDQSLVMAASALRDELTARGLADLIISKALWADIKNFQATWNDKTLARQLSYGWEMSYPNCGGPDQRLRPYNELGQQYRLQRNQLALGVSNENSTNRTPAVCVTPQTTSIKSGGDAGMMIFETEIPEGTYGAVVYAGLIAQVLYGQKATIKPACWVNQVEPA
jgi:hypothetical protein